MTVDAWRLAVAQLRREGVMELDTAVRHRLPVVIVVSNNAAWGIERNSQVADFGEDRVVGTLPRDCRFDLVARAFGGHGERVTEPAEIGPAVRRALGGPSRAAADAIDLMDAAGRDLVFVETVGVGQDEVDIMRVAHTVIVVSVPGLGDDVQTLKAGILEIADVHAVNKICPRRWPIRVRSKREEVGAGRPSVSSPPRVLATRGVQRQSPSPAAAVRGGQYARPCRLGRA